MKTKRQPTNPFDDLTKDMLEEDPVVVERVVERIVEKEVPVEVPVPVGLVRGENGVIWVGNIAILATGIYINGEITQEEWKAFFPFIRRVQDASQWFYGDMMAYGDRVWGKTYAEVAEEADVDADTLRNWAWVAANVDLSLRNDKLSFTHHYHVAGLSQEEQAMWLSRALDNRWSANRLLQEISDSRPTPPSELDKVARYFAQNRQRYERYERRFEKAGQGVKAQLSQMIDQEIDALEALKRSLR